MGRSDGFRTVILGLLATICVLVAAPLVGQQGVAPPPPPPTSHYWVYVAAESADVLHRVRFGPEGTVVEKTFPVGEYADEIEGPHGLIISPDAQHLYMTTGHGHPDGRLWKYELGPDTLVAPGVLLGMFPASLDITPDGLYTFSSNFNLHGDMVPSSISVVYTPSMVEVDRVVTCTMPHGGRIDPSGTFHYSTCMMDDQLVEIDTRTFQVSRRFPVSVAGEGSHGGGLVMDHGDHAHSCSPTWAHPSPEGEAVYVVCNAADLILEVDREEWTVTRRYTTGRGPYNVDVTRDGRLLVATLKQGGMFEVFDRASGESLAVFRNSTTVAHGIALSPDSRYAFVSSEGVGAEPGQVDIYDLRALAHVGSAEVGQQAGGIAFWKMEPAGTR